MGGFSVAPFSLVSIELELPSTVKYPLGAVAGVALSKLAKMGPTLVQLLGRPFGNRGWGFLRGKRGGEGQGQGGGRVNSRIIIFIRNENRMHVNRKGIQIFSNLGFDRRFDSSCRRIREVVILEQGVHLLRGWGSVDGGLLPVDQVEQVIVHPGRRRGRE